MKKVTTRTKCAKTIMIKPDVLKNINPPKQDTKQNNEMEEKLIKTLKEYLKAKVKISNEQSDISINKILNFINSIVKEKSTNTDEQLQSVISENDNQSECIDTSSVKPQQKDDDKIEISGYIAASSNQPQEENCPIQQSKSSIHKIPKKIINSTIKVQDLAQSFEKAVDGVVTTNGYCTTNVIVCKKDIIQERTFNFQTLLSLFENK